MTDNKHDLFPPRLRHLTRAEASDCEVVYQRLIAEYEVKRSKDGSQRQMSEIYLYKGFWVRAYGAEGIVISDAP